MRKDNKKTSFVIVSLLSMLIAGCGTGNSSSASSSTSSNIKNSESSQTHSSSKDLSSSGNSNHSSLTSSSTSSSSTSTFNPETDAKVFISNKDELEEAWKLNNGDRMIKLTTNDGVDAALEVEKGNIVITSSNEDVLKVYGLYLHPIATGEAEVTVSYYSSTDTVKINIGAQESLAPRLFLDYDGFSVFETFQRMETAIPSFICIDRNNNDITSSVTVTSDIDPNAVYDIAKGTFTTNVQGEHTLTYTASDLEDPSLKTEKTIKLNVFRNLFKATHTDWQINNYKNPGQEFITTNNGGYSLCQLDYEPSSYYYIETVVEMPSGHHGGQHAAIATFNPSDTSKSLVFDMDFGDYNWKIKNFKTSGDGAWSLEGEIDNWRLGQYFLKEVPTEDENTIKLGLVRRGQEFYMFVNDGYVGMVTNKEYSNVDTYPGFFAHAGSAGTKFTNINYISGLEAVNEKFNSLIGNGESFVTNYVARGYEWAFGSQNIDNRNYTVNERSEKRGLNFDFTNETTSHNTGMVSLYQYFDSDFTFEFDYKPTTETTLTEKDCKMWLEARPYNFSDEIFWIGTKFRTSDAEQMIKRIKTDVVKETWDTKTITNPREGMHYEVIRTMNETNCTITLRITSLADPTQVIEASSTYSGSCWNDKLILIWHNTNLAGQFSNIEWSTGGAQ